jgi:urea transport system ATP-binding protein
MLTISGLNQYYGESHTLWDLDMEVAKGKCTVLMGRNGVGKTTLLQCIMGLVKVKSHVQEGG